MGAMPPFFLHLSAMLVRIAVLFVLLALSSELKAQVQLVCDTLKYEDRTGGAFDSVDVANSWSSSTFDGGYDLYTYRNSNVSSLVNVLTSPQYLIPLSNKEFRYTSLPHIGFAYSFGGQGSQFLRANYSQSFTERISLNIDYSRNSSNGYLRNGAMENHYVSLKFRAYGKRLAIWLEGSYGLFKTDYSGGITTDTLINDFGLEFTPTKKSQASQKASIGNARLRTELNFLDSARRFGLTTNHEFSIYDRLYTEEDTLYGIYNEVYIDSFATYDRYNLPKLSNGGGFFLSNSSFYLNAMIEHAYWRYRNLSLQSDTNELNLRSELLFMRGGLDISNDFSFNLYGNFNGIEDQFHLSYARDRWKLLTHFSFISGPPEVFKRFYRGNNFQFELGNIGRTSTVQTGGDIEIRAGDQLIGGGIAYTGLSQPYVWQDTSWTDDVYGTLSFFSVSLKADVSYKALHINNRFRYTYNDEKLTPSFAYDFRLFSKFKIFEAKRLELLAGVHGLMLGQFSKRSFIPALDQQVWSSSPEIMPTFFNMSVFAGMQIDEFRFYLRFENLAYLWNDKLRSDISDYPIPSTRLRIGVVWDFYN
jgi:hypothetical protein